MNCERDWYDKFGEPALDHFGRVTEPKRLDCDDAWYKYRDWQKENGYYFVNDLLGERRPITQAQYRDESFIRP
jgi:hypothetical protein